MEKRRTFSPQSADKAHKRKNCSDIKIIRCNFCFLRQQPCRRRSLTICKLPCRQVCFLGLQAFSTLCQSVDFVNIPRRTFSPVTDRLYTCFRHSSTQIARRAGKIQAKAWRRAKSRKKRRPVFPGASALTCGAWLRPDRRRARAGLPAIRSPCPPWQLRLFPARSRSWRT